MNSFEIFRQGKHTASGGQTLEFTEAMLAAAVIAYDPAIHEAPIVVGHPKDNGPAYGWIKSLSFADGAITAEAIQLDPEFSEMVEAGRFKKRSASFYLPDSPSNPIAGTLYLRHVGFLGAQPPAVKGLKDINFSDTEEGVVEFSDPYIVASVFRKLREFILTKFSAEDADRVVPDYYIQSLEEESRTPAVTEQAGALTTFTETPEDEMSKELQAKIDELTAANAALIISSKPAADFAEAQASLQAREQAMTKRELESALDTMITEGRVLPAQKAKLVEFMAGLDDTAVTVEFKEGEAEVKQTPRGFMIEFLKTLPKAVDFKEHSKEDGAQNGAEMTGRELADKAVHYRETMAEKGVVISVTEAVIAIRDGKTV